MRKAFTGFYLASLAIVLIGIFVAITIESSPEPESDTICQAYNDGSLECRDKNLHVDRDELMARIEIEDATVCIRILDEQEVKIRFGHDFVYRDNQWFIDGVFVGTAPSEDSATVLCGNREQMDLIDLPTIGEK